MLACLVPPPNLPPNSPHPSPNCPTNRPWLRPPQVVSEAGRIDLLVNNAGIAHAGPLTEADPQAARHLFEVNFWGAVALCQAVGKIMIQQRCGTIVNIGSMAGHIHPPMMSFYAASKAAIESVSNALRVELRPFGVSVVHVAPTWVATNIMKGAHFAPAEEWATGDYAPVRELLYKGFEDVTRLGSAWAPERMARVIAGKALKRRPPWLVFGGSQWRFYRLLSAFPRFVVQAVLFQKFGMGHLARALRQQRRAAGAGGPAGGGAGGVGAQQVAPQQP